MKSAISILQKNPKLDNNNKIFSDALTLLKEAEDVECEVNKQLDTAIKNDNVSYKNSCLPPVGVAF